MKRCKKCNKPLFFFNRWRENKEICWNCGFCDITEQATKLFGEDIREKVYKMEERVRKT